jgi:hypothetical protein
MILKESKEEMATVASIPNMKRRISLSIRATYLLFHGSRNIDQTNADAINNL